MNKGEANYLKIIILILSLNRAKHEERVLYTIGER